MLAPRATLARSPHAFFTPTRALDPRRTLFSRAQKPPGWQPFYRRHPRVFALLAAPFVVGGSLGVALLGLWAYDASTYHHPHAGRVPVDPVALRPERGGKKNLKIAASLIDDLDERLVNARDKKRLVIVGGGWGVRPGDHSETARELHRLTLLASSFAGRRHPAASRPASVARHCGCAR